MRIAFQPVTTVSCVLYAVPIKTTATKTDAAGMNNRVLAMHLRTCKK